MARPQLLTSAVTSRGHTALIVGLILVIAVCAVLLGVWENLSRPWAVTLQVASAVAGAALGNALRLDLSRQAVRNQARPATRHLFDQAARLRTMTQQVEGLKTWIQKAHTSATPLDHQRVGDWFGNVGEGLRSEIAAVATALENWGDLAPGEIEAELQKYQNRDKRLPGSPDGKEADDD